MKKQGIEMLWVIQKDPKGVLHIEQFANELNAIKYVEGVLTTSHNAVSVLKGTAEDIRMHIANDTIEFVTNQYEIKSKYHKIIINANAREKSEAWQRKHAGSGEAKQYTKEVRSK
jgi:hypothetical protein